MSTANWPDCAIEDVVEDVPNALCIGPFGSDLLASDFVDCGVPVVFVRNVRPGRFEHADSRYVTDAKAAKLRAHRVHAGDIVITKMGLPPCVAAEYPVGAPDGIITADIIKLTPNRKRIDGRYLVYFLNSQYARAQVAAITFGVTRPKVTLKEFRKLRLPVPPLPEQKRIAAILDKADAMKRKRQEAIRLTEELLRSAFLEMFGDPVTNPKGWKTVLLGEAADVHRGRFSPRPRNDPRFYGGTHPFVQTGDVANAPNYLTTWTQTLNDRGAAVSKAFPPNSVLVAIVGATIVHARPRTSC